ncbi:MAG: bifunctional phosphopantothenoylcysteine decarboxylase/phosphopantothenate--cysteine ligase CoaBC [Rhodothermales bacterium]
MTANDGHPDLEGRHILLGVTGGIAAYKSVELVRLLKKAGADVQVLMTPDAGRFITPLTLGTVSERPVLTEIFVDGDEGSWTRHISLGRWADLFVIAPATAHTLAKLAHGFSDNMLTATALAARCPLLICPAMDHDMFVHPATQKNLEVLAEFGYTVMPPAYGSLASGLVGQGRLPEPESIRDAVVDMLGDRAHGESLAGQRVLVTAGPTREHIDPVRYISNPSSGKMGFALAAAAARRGADVTLVTGPTHLPTPSGVTRVDVESAEQMHSSVMEHRGADVIIMAAAVADYSPIETSTQKMKKHDGDVALQLRRTPDILSELGARRSDDQILVGFAMETDDGLAHAREKLDEKNVDWIVLNTLTDEGAGFGVDTNRVTLISRLGEEEELPLMSKRRVAEAILDRLRFDATKPAA